MNRFTGGTQIKHFVMAITVLAAVMQSSSDWAAARLAGAIERVAEALVEPEPEARIMAAHELLRARP